MSQPKKQKVDIEDSIEVVSSEKLQTESFHDLEKAVPLSKLISKEHSFFLLDPNEYQLSNFFISEDFWKRPEIKFALTLIFQFLNVKCICNCSLVSKLWNEATNQSSLWQFLYQSYFDLSQINSDWKAIFKT